MQQSKETRLRDWNPSFLSTTTVGTPWAAIKRNSITRLKLSRDELVQKLLELSSNQKKLDYEIETRSYQSRQWLPASAAIKRNSITRLKLCIKLDTKSLFDFSSNQKKLDYEIETNSEPDIALQKYKQQSKETRLRDWNVASLYTIGLTQYDQISRIFTEFGSVRKPHLPGECVSPNVNTEVKLDKFWTISYNDKRHWKFTGARGLCRRVLNYTPVMHKHHRCLALPYICELYDRAGFYHIPILGI